VFYLKVVYKTTDVLRSAVLINMYENHLYFRKVDINDNSLCSSVYDVLNRSPVYLKDSQTRIARIKHKMSRRYFKGDRSAT